MGGEHSQMQGWTWLLACSRPWFWECRTLGLYPTLIYSDAKLVQKLWGARYLICCRDNEKILWWLFWKDYPLSQSTYAQLGSMFLGVGKKKCEKGQRQTQVQLWTAWTKRSQVHVGAGSQLQRQKLQAALCKPNMSFSIKIGHWWLWLDRNAKYQSNTWENIPKTQESRTQFDRLEKRVHSILQSPT